MKKRTDEYFDDRKRVAALNLKIIEAIPSGEYYHVIVLALQQVINTFINEWIESACEKRWIDKDGK